MISFGLTSSAGFGDLVHVDELVLAAHGVVRDLEPLAGHVDGRAVGEMAAGREVEAHEGVAGLQQRQEHRLVHLAAGVRLHVGEVARRTASWRDRSRGSRRRRRTRNRRSSARPDRPSAYLLVITEPCASSTARLTMFSEAISSISWRCRPSSPLMAAAISGIGLSSEAVKKESGAEAVLAEELILRISPPPQPLGGTGGSGVAIEKRRARSTTSAAPGQVFAVRA